MELSTRREPTSFVATRQYHSTVYNPKAHHLIHKNFPLSATVNQTNPVHTTPSLKNKIRLNVIHPLRLDLLSGITLSGFSISSLFAVFSPIQSTCPTHLIHLDLIILIILGVEYKSCSSSVCSFLHSSVTASLFGPNILLSNLYSNTPSLCSSLNVRDHMSHQYRTIGNIIVYINY
jgi:hypothetical protein